MSLYQHGIDCSGRNMIRFDGFEVGQPVQFVEATDVQVRWGGNDDPRLTLSFGDIYEITNIDVHSQHTKLTLQGFPGFFNSVHFRPVEAGR